MKEPSTEHILVVEDNRDTQILLKYLLDAQFSLTIVPGVTEALEQTSNSPFDLLLVDINLGEQRTGVDLLRILRDIEDYRDVPVIAITAYAMPGDPQRFLRMGFNAYISKPFSREELFKVIDELLPRKIT